MLHPLVRLIATRPHLLAEHVGGYVDLLRVQTHDVMQMARTRAVLSAGMGAGAVLGLTLAGVALLLFAVVPTAEMPHPWLLLLAPALPLFATVACWWLLRQQPPLTAMDALRDQLAADVALLREASD